MASSWTTYTPDSRLAGDIKSSESDTSPPTNAVAWTPPLWNSIATYPDHSDLALNSSPASSEVLQPTAKHANMKVPSAQGRTEPNSFSSNVVRFTPTKGSRMEAASKPALAVVSATSLRVEFRDPAVAATSRGDALSIGPLPVKSQPRLSSSLLRATHSPYSLRSELPPVSTTPLFDVDWSAHHTSNTDRPDNAAPSVDGFSHPTHKQVVAPRSSSSLGTGDTIPQIANSGEHVVPGTKPSWTLDQHVLDPTSIMDSPSVAPILVATDVTPQPHNGPIQPDPISTTDIRSTSPPSLGASQRTPATPSTTLNTGFERNKQRRRPRKTATWVSDGSGSIVLSRYTEMMFEDVPTVYTFFSCFFTWILLAGFVVLPGTFATLDSFETPTGEIGRIIRTIRHLPLMVVAYACCAVGGLGMCLLWVRWSHNYVWLLGNIFIPGLLNGLSGVLSTFVGIYATQNGRYGPSSIATLAVTGACTVICAFLTAIYSFWKLNTVKKKHVRETEQVRKVGSEVGEVQSPK